jgi:diguanylate cyclase (GGDEF)-like protein/PAS domain S-box-containing protein
MMKILIAEDDEGIHELLTGIVQDLGWASDWARTAKATADLIERNEYAMLVLDYALPDRNAQEFIEELMKQEKPIPPFILSTGQGDERIAVSMMKLGARDYIIKDSYFLERFPEVLKRVSSELENDRKLKSTENALRKSEALLFGLFSQAPMSIQVVDSDGLTVNVNAAFERMWGISSQSAIGKLNVLTDPRSCSIGLCDAIESSFRGEVVYVNEFSYNPNPPGKPEETIVFSIVCFPIKEGDDVLSVVILADNITRQKEAEEKIHRLAFYDSLTGLPNRSLMMDRLAQRLSFLQRYGKFDVFILLNIDRFKIINDARGNLVGDALLGAVGKRIQALMRDADTVARMTADEFAILLPYEDPNPDLISLNTLTIAERIRESLRTPFEIEGETFTITASIGITLLSEDVNDTAGAVLRRADTALHRAKGSGGNQSAFFETGMGESASESYQIERELGQAVINKELRMFLQPQVDANGRFVGAEALLRWQHPVRGLLPPGVFIPIAEQSDLIVELGSWVMTQACRLLAEQNAKAQDFRISVNVSPRHFRKSNFVTWFKNVLTRSGADPTRLTLEITESLFIDNMSDVIAKMTELVTHGIHFSIDDFGTGYSSLAYIKRLPIDELKIDKTFVQDAPSDSNDAALVETILAVADHMRLKVVAEGVETEAQAKFLNERATVIHQGYLYGRPEPAEKCLEKWNLT